MYIVLKQVSVFLESTGRVHEIKWKALSLQVTQSRCRSTETNLLISLAASQLLTGVNNLGAIPKCDR